MWPDLIQKAKDGGLDVIQTYVFWNGHEPSPGKVMQCCWQFLFDCVSLLLFSLRKIQFFFIWICCFSTILKAGMIL